MKTLKSLIRQIDGWNLKSPQDILNILNIKNIEYIDKTPWTWAGIADVVGNNGAESLKTALEKNGMGWAVYQLGGIGLDLSVTDVQNALYYLENIGVKDMEKIATSVKRMISILEQNEIHPTETDIEEAKACLLLEEQKQQLITENANRWNRFCNAVNSWDGTEPQPEF